MLQRLSSEIRECYRHAAEARQKAEATTHLPTKAEYEDVERRWLSLARSYEFSEQLARFTNGVKRNIRKQQGTPPTTNKRPAGIRGASRSR